MFSMLLMATRRKTFPIGTKSPHTTHFILDTTRKPIPILIHTFVLDARVAYNPPEVGNDEEMCNNQ